MSDGGASAARAPGPSRPVPFRDAVRVWLRVAALSFGGPAGQIAVMHRTLVDEKRWLSESRFLHALNFCMLLPGPEAMQLATYVGWLLHRTRGGIVAGTLFVLPGFASILVLSVLYAGWRDVPLIDALFYGLKPAVLAVVVEAVVRVGRRALRHRLRQAIAAAAFLALFAFAVPFPAVVLGAGLLGWIGGRRGLPGLGDPPSNGLDPAGETPIADAAAAAAPDHRRAVVVAAVWLVLWLGPVAALVATLGPRHVLAREALFFSKTAVITFGGAYAVLAYIAQRAVATYGWLSASEMLDGLGLAETTPGPLIQVVQFVGFLGAYRDPGGLDPLVAGLLGAIITTWVTYTPCFLWIFLGAPYVELLRGHRSLATALSAITAAVVGVILNVAVWFAAHTLFGEVAERRAGPLHWLAPDVATLDPVALAIAVAAAIALFRLRAGMIRVLLAAMAAGLVVRLVLGS